MITISTDERLDSLPLYSYLLPLLIYQYHSSCSSATAVHHFNRRTMQSAAAADACKTEIKMVWHDGCRTVVVQYCRSLPMEKKEKNNSTNLPADSITQSSSFLHIATHTNAVTTQTHTHTHTNTHNTWGTPEREGHTPTPPDIYSHGSISLWFLFAETVDS